MQGTVNASLTNCAIEKSPEISAKRIRERAARAVELTNPVLRDGPATRSLENVHSNQLVFARY